MAKRLKVIQISSGFAIEGPLGGIERFVTELAQALPPDIEPIVCGMWDYHTPSDRYWLEALRAAGIRAFCAAPWREQSPYASFQAALQGAREVLAGETVDLIHSHCQFGDPLAMALQRRLGAKHLVRTVHNEKEWPRRPERRWLFSGGIAVTAFKRELGVSQGVVDILDRRPVARLLRKRALLCYNSVNVERFARPVPPEIVAAYRTELGVPSDARVIGSVGRLEPQKGYQYLIAAMPAIVAAHPDVHVVLAGTGSLAEELQTQADALPCAAHIHLVGTQTGIERLYGVLSLFVSSSLWEGLPTVLLESMAARVPVIATDVAGSRELVQAGETGVIVPPRNSDVLANGIIEVLHHPDRASDWANNAVNTLTRFSIQTAAAFHATLYHELI